jgi:cysteine desulfurase / selenocysteine lyase
MSVITTLIGSTDAFPILKNWRFFNHAGVAPLPRAAADAFTQYATQAATAAYVGWGWHADIEKLRQSLAVLVNAHRDEIAFVKNTSEGISIVASGLDWQFGDRIVTTAVEYPANIYPWMEVARSHGAKLILVPEEDAEDGSRHVPLEKILEAASDPHTRMIALSHVEFASGQRHDLVRIGQFCHDHDIYFCVDAIQSLGILPVDVQAMKIDFLSADGHKWLLGPEGAGFFYCRRDLIEHVRPLMVGWMNVVDAMDYGKYDYTLRTDAGRFECGSYNVPGLLSFQASVDLLLSAGILPISRRVKGLGDLFIKGLKSKGYKIVSPRSAEKWSGITSFVSSSHNHQRIFEELRHKKIELALREHRLRLSPHFYNTESQIQTVLDALPDHD